ncbi:hypothetical protein BGX24_004307 [Mortierella sp. AD032]|nr:hypothetical protein BGX24_004307 [Mortierella sp. AD032]
MREPNFSFPGQNRAAICITSSIYDRRALDCTDYIPIINTLTNLAYLTGSTPTIREYITRDGGLERLVTILKNTKVNDRKNGLKWTLAFQCVVNIGVRGTEHIRKRVVQAGMVPVIVNVLESFFAVLKSVSDENERRRLLRRAEAAQQQSQPLITDDTNAPMLTQTHSTTQPYGGPMTEETGLLQQDSGLDNSNDSSSSAHSSASITAPSLASTSTSVTTGSTAPSTANLPTVPSAQHPVHYPHSVPEAGQAAQDTTHPDDARSIAQEGATGEVRPQQFFYREDDILHSLQLLAYLSKYPSLRSSFHTESGSNVFAIVEKFTHRTMHPLEIQYWAGVIMRNACRKDDTRKGIRQCAYTGCGKWETKPREFAKCRRCRKAKYCSKQCQSKAWNEGHRWWCIEKKAETMGVSTSFGTDLPPAPPPPPPPADLQDQPDGNPNLMENGGLASLATAGATGARMIGGGDGGSNHGHHVSRMQQQHHHHHQTPAHQSNPVASSSTTPSPYSHLMAPTTSRAGSSSQHQQQAPQPQQGSPQQRLPQHQVQQQPQPQPQPQQARYPTMVPQAHLSQPQPQQPRLPQHLAPQHPSQPYQQPQPQHHRHPQQQQPERSHQQVPPRHLQGSPEPMQAIERHSQQAAPLERRPFNPQQMIPGQAGPSPIAHHHLHRAPQRSMSTPHPSTAPLMPTSRTEMTLHLGITPDSPTPEQLAQRFVQQVALHPGQHNELAQHLHAQFQQYFPPHNQAEAKRQFSFHAREYFSRYQRQQELLRSGAQGSSSGPHNNVAGRPAPGRAPMMPLAVPPQAQMSPYRPLPVSASAPRSGRESESHRQGTLRRRSDLDSDDDDPSLLESGSHSTSSMSVPMLTQDLSTLSTTMSLSSTEISGPLPVSPVESRYSAGSSLGSSSSSSLIAANGSRSDLVKSESSSSLRDYKVRKLMSPDQSGSSSSASTGHGHGNRASASDLPNQQGLQRGDEWSYSRHMAKDAPTAP